jgi:nicotinamide-nucleotide amidase
MRSAHALASQVLDRARARGVMVATAESCTGGLVSAALTEIAGSSAVMDRGFVTYTNEAKQDLLGVRPGTLERHGAVSSQTAREMAQGALARSQAALAVSITGVAGPGGGSADKPVGLVWFGLARTGQDTRTLERRFGDVGRSKVRALSVETALTLLRDALR